MLRKCLTVIYFILFEFVRNSNFMIFICNNNNKMEHVPPQQIILGIWERLKKTPPTSQ